jgi:preprotein translocase subunit SecY
MEHSLTGHIHFCNFAGADSRVIGFISEFVTIFSGGSFISGSILSLGLLPYLSAQMAADAIAYVGDLPLGYDRIEGEKFMTKWTIYLIIPFGILETIFLLFLTTPICGGNIFQVFYRNQTLDLIFAARTFLVLIVGSLFALWMSELISKYGIKGQGASLIIFAGISVDVIREFANIQSGGLDKWIAIIIYGILTTIGILFLVFLTHGRRNISVLYAGRYIGNRSSMPVRGVLPLRVSSSSDGLVGSNLLLALSFIYLPLLACLQTQWAQKIALWVTSLLGRNFYLFGPIAFILVFLFTFIFVDNQFMASYYAPSLQRSGGQIPGVPSGNATHYYLRSVQRRIAIANALGLALVSILPWGFIYLTQSNVSLLDAQRWVFAIVVIHEVYMHIDTERKLAGYRDSFLVR